MVEILTFVATTIVGAYIGLFIGKYDSWIETKKRGDLRGEWFAVSHGADESFVKDKITVIRKRGKLYFKNVGNDFGYSYEAYCSVEANNVLTGTWRSLRIGASIVGRVTMIVNPQGDTITGIYTGKNTLGNDLFMAWQLTRQEKALEETQRSLKSYFKFP